MKAGDIECLERRKEFILYGNAPDATPKKFETFSDVHAAFLEAKAKWPKHRHRIAMQTMVVEEITLLLVEETR